MGNLGPFYHCLLLGQQAHTVARWGRVRCVQLQAQHQPGILHWEMLWGVHSEGLPGSYPVPALGQLQRCCIH